MEEFLRSIPVPTVLGVINMEPLSGSAIMEIDPPIASAIINRLCFGIIESSGSRFELTDIGKNIMENVFSSLLENLREAWSAVTDLRPQLGRIETDPIFTRLCPPREGVVIVTLEVKMEDVEGMINFCIPYPLIEPVMGKPIREKLIFEDGSVDEGDFVEGRLHGKGKRTYNDGAVYIGDFVNGLRHGKGKTTNANGDVHEGDYANGNSHGKGKYTWADDGTVYEGDFVDSKFHGKGKITYADGRVYEGDCADDKRNGQGKMTYPDGRVEEGEWKDGEFVK
jgi:hypothetical protein